MNKMVEGALGCSLAAAPKPSPQQRLLEGWAPPEGVDGVLCSGITQGIVHDHRRRTISSLTNEGQRGLSATEAYRSEHVSITRSLLAGYDDMIKPRSPLQ